MDKFRDEVIANLRACLISCKGKIPLSQLESDYRLLLGERIPYTQLGYKSLEDFVCSIPSLHVNRTANGQCFVDAKTSEKSSHITEMINKQKAPKKKPPPRPHTVRFNSYSRTAPTKNWRPNVAYTPRKFKTTQRTIAVAHNQLVTKSPVKSPQYSVKSRLVIPEDSSLRKMGMSEPHKDHLEPSRTIVEGPKVDISQKVNGPLNTPMRGGYHLSKPPYEASTTVNRLKSSNCVKEFVEKGPVNLETFSSSLLQTSKKRIEKMMGEISLDRDSGNSSPVEDLKCSSPETGIVLTDNPIADLKNIVDTFKLGKIDVNFTTMKPKKRYAPVIYTCTIKVGGQTYLSYPKDFNSEKSAEEYCAKMALEDLVPKCNKRKSFLLSTCKDIKERIPPMLKAHFQGIWSWQIEQDYLEKYLEQLPPNWLEVVDSCDCVQVERIQDRFVLRYCRPGTIDPYYPTNDKENYPYFWSSLMSTPFLEIEEVHPTTFSFTQKGDLFSSLLPLDISIPSNTVQFGEDNRLFAQITCIISLNEVWCRQYEVEEFKAFDEMISKMETYYNGESEKHKTTSAQLGSYYVARYDSNWYRVRALEIQEKTINCFLIDFGDEYSIPNESLYTIRREFATLQAQAFVCRLAGLEDLYDINIPSDKLTSYLGKEVVLEAVQNTEDTASDQTLPVVMYDCSSGYSVNEEILQFLTIEIAMPVIIPNTIQEVYVSHLCETGDVYVQVHSKGFAAMRTLTLNLEEEIAENPPHHCRADMTKSNWLQNKDALYLVKNDKDGKWYRGRILDMKPDGSFAQILFVDRGNFEIFKVNEVTAYPLEKISDALNKFPAQAVRVKMALETVPADFVALAGKWLELDKPALLKMAPEDGGRSGAPTGDFYMRSAGTGVLMSINASIMAMTAENETSQNSILKGTRTKLVKLTQLKDESLQDNVPSGGSLNRPELPGKNEYFDVFVPFAVNPWNFFVQPYSFKDELNRMMCSLQTRYENAAFSPLHIGSILPGQIYATKHIDGIWYRTSVLKVINPGSISVFYCDFGYYSNLRLDELVPLAPEFMVLPYQALKAKLSGIKPRNGKWSLEDCDIFTELTKGKPFVSVLVDIETDELYESDPVLKLTLIDTSTDEDVFIGEELVRRNIAIKSD